MSHIKYYILYIVTNRLLLLVLSVEDSYRVATVEDKGFSHHSRVQKNLTKQKKMVDMQPMHRYKSEGWSHSTQG